MKCASQSSAFLSSIVFCLTVTHTFANQTDTDPQKSPNANTQNNGQRDELNWPSWHLSVGGLWLAADGVYSLEFAPNEKIRILDFDTAGLEKRDSSHYLSAVWRDQDSPWGALLATWHFDASGTRNWTNELDLGNGVVIPVGASVLSNVDTSFYIGELTYSILRNAELDVGVGLGIHAVDFETTLAATVNVSELEQELFREKLEVLAPLPNLSGYAIWRVSPRWSITSRLAWFGLSYDKFGGEMVSANVRLDYDLTASWSLGIGYQYIRMDLRVDELEDEGYVEILDFDLMGPLATLSYRF